MTKRDRTGLPSGPWDTEPDRVEWRDTATGLPCLIVRNDFGALCGYVSVPPGHPLHGVPYDDVSVEVHGGLTYSDRCAGHICHEPAPGEPADVWWFGFDCAHGWDVVPRLNLRFPGAQYRTVAYVRAECTRLAAALRKVTRRIRFNESLA